MNFLNGLNPLNWYSTTQRVTNDAGKITHEVIRQPAFTPRDVINPIAAATATTQKVDRWIAGGFGLQGATLQIFESDLEQLYAARDEVQELNRCICKICTQIEKITQQQSWYFHQKNKKELVKFCNYLSNKFTLMEQIAENYKGRVEDLRRLAQERMFEWGVADYVSESCEIF